MTGPQNLVYDVAIVGLGAMGSAAAYHLSRRGLNVLGLDQFDPPHTLGSSHGETRVIREAYFEHPSYVPLVQRAYELWTELEQESGEQLYLRTGGVMIGPPGSAVVQGAVQSAREHQLDHEILDASNLKQRFPALKPTGEMLGVFEPRAGILFPERCIAAHLKLAKILGAEICPNQKAVNFQPDSDQVILRTATDEYRARKVILSTGAWIPQLLPSISRSIQVSRQVLLWFDAADPTLFAPMSFPIHLWEYEPGKMFYGFPDLGTGVKVAFHNRGELTAPDSVDRSVSALDVASMRKLLERYLPAGNGPFLRGTVCLYTNTPDGHFILDYHPTSRRVILTSPCSGHGFKFASVIGEVLADLALDAQSTFDLSLFRLNRFS